MICGRPLPPGPEAVPGEAISPTDGLTSHGEGTSGGGAPHGSSPRSPRAAKAHRPVRRAFDLGLANFLLVLIGTGSLVAGTWNARRHVEIAELRGVRDRLERERFDLGRAIEEERRWYEGVEADPLFRRELLERLLGTSSEEGIPLDEWLQGAGAAPEA